MDTKNFEEEITYGYVSEKDGIMNSCWFNTFDEAKEAAKSDQPANRPYLILERVEHFEVVGRVK